MSRKRAKYVRYVMIFFLLFLLWWTTKLIGCGQPTSLPDAETTTTTISVGTTTTTLYISAVGTLDATFSDGTNSGYAVNKGVAGSDSSDTINAIAIDSQGKIIAVGTAGIGVFPVATSMFILKYNADGSFDTTFGSGGKVVATGSAGADFNDSGYGIAVDSLDNIIVVGRSIDPNSAVSAGSMVVWRYKSDGTPDTSFAGGAGKVLQTLSDYHIIYAYAVALDSSGRIVVTGNATHKTFPGDGDVFVARYNSDGTLDTSFSDGTHPGFSLFDGVVVADGNEYGYSLVFDAAGNILVGGMAQDSSFNPYLAVFKFTASGPLDSSFGDGTHSGYSIYHNSYNDNSGDFGQGITMDADGKIYVAGYCIGNYGTMSERRAMAIWKLGSNGRKESAVIYTPATSESYTITTDRFGKIIVAGRVQPASTSDLGIWRYNSDLTIDSSFGSGGVVDFDTTSTILGVSGSNVEIARAVAVDSGGRIVVGGSMGGAVSNSSIVLRYK